MKCPRCKKTLEKNHPWQECYECIRKVYPETKIIICNFSHRITIHSKEFLVECIFQRIQLEIQSLQGPD